MLINRGSGFPFRPSLSLVLLFVMLLALWAAGGASREDALGQAMVRSTAVIVLVVGIMFGGRPSFSRVRPVLYFLVAAVVLALAQLIPLPPAMWQALPDRTVFADAARAGGIDQPWRPLSIVPGATANAAASLLVPIAVLVLVAGLPAVERRWLPGIILAFIVASMLVGLLQFSGAAINNPFINDGPGEVSGSFANRNHLALFLALGCLLAPVWAFLDGRKPHWRAPTAFGFMLLFALTILASGSRTGLILGALALGGGLFLVRQSIRRALSRAPRWVFPALIAAAVGVIAIVLLLSFAADRAASINRTLALDPGQDLRVLGLPTVLAMTQSYFPFGSGLGGFDQIFRMHEPFEMLRPVYFNHAHNDLVEVVLDAGLPGLLLLVAALLWWGWASLRAWRASSGSRDILPKLGSAMLLLIIIASVFDYPARTPMIMAMIVLAGVWLSDQVGGSGGATLRESGQSL